MNVYNMDECDWLDDIIKEHHQSNKFLFKYIFYRIKRIKWIKKSCE